MREVRRTAIVPYTPQQMYAIVNDVRRYPEFVPWCPATRVHAETETSIEATVDVQRSGVRLSLTTRNSMRPGELIELSLVDGPLRTLEGSWRFEPILERATPVGNAAATSAPVAGDPSEPGADAPPAPRVRGCRVELEVRFDFKSAALTVLFGPVFEASWDSLVDAFVVRARALHGTARA
jgi:ribosome-associated toxin RatA of RatAB toxin-antitoxin module